jgi:hypothetical protein
MPQHIAVPVPRTGTETQTMFGHSENHKTIELSR